MGCDIHLQVERRTDARVWQRVPHPERTCDWCEGTGKNPDTTPNEKMRGEPCYDCQGTGRTIKSFYDNRNYSVFAILADVRNGSGVRPNPFYRDSGLMDAEDERLEPISEPRGWPHDLSSLIHGVAENILDWCASCLEFRTFKEKTNGDKICTHCGADMDAINDGHGRRSQSFWMGDHSWSWLTIAELLAYDWDRTIVRHGIVDPHNFALIGAQGMPESWCMAMSGRDVRHITPAQMRELLSSGRLKWTADKAPNMFDGRPYVVEGDPPNVTYVTVGTWTQSYRDVASDFLTVLHRDLVPLGPPEDVRIVFGFDS